MITSKLINSCGAYNIRYYIAKRSLGTRYGVGRFFCLQVIVTTASRVKARFRHFLSYRVVFREGGLYGEVCYHVQGFGRPSSVSSYASYHRYARQGCLYGVVFTMFARGVISGLSPTFLAGVSVGVKRASSFKVRGSFGGGVMLCQVGYNCTCTMNAG